MPKQRSLPRRRAAPLNLNENLFFDEMAPETVLPQPPRTSRRKKQHTDTVNSNSNNNSVTTSTESPAINLVNPNTNLQTPAESVSSLMPSAEDIATNLMKQLQNSGLLFPGGDKTVNTQTLSAAFAMSSQTETCNTNSAQQIPVQLQPPLMSDPMLNTLSSQSQLNRVTDSIQSIPSHDITELGINNDIMGSTARYMLNNTLPLGYHVCDATKQKIWNDSYVEFHALLPNFNLDDDNDDDVLFRSRKIKISHTTKPKEILTMHQWNELLIFSFPSIC